MGMSVVAVLGRRVCYSRSFGLANVSRGVPITDATMYRVASVSKSVTATAVMILHDLGLLHLDDDVSGHLGYAVRNPRHPDVPITARMLLSHTSSLTDGGSYDEFLNASYYADPPPPLAGLLDGASGHGSGGLYMERAPGTRFEYANVNYGILGTLVESITEMRFDVFCRERIFVPLKMNATFNIRDVDDIDTVAALYRKVEGTWTPQMDDYGGVLPPTRDLSGYRPGTNAVIFSPQGGMRASANALATFTLMHMNNGAWNGASVLKPETATLMRQAQFASGDSEGPEGSWGLGFRLPARLPGADEAFGEGSVAGHSGEAYGLLSAMYFDASKGTGVVFITNGCGAKLGVREGSGFYAVEEELLRTVSDFVGGL